MRTDTQKIALCGIFGALALLVMLGGNLIPLAVYICPALAGLLILPVAHETDRRTGLLFYAGIALLALFLLPDKEPAVLFIAFLGYYPLLKYALEKIRPAFFCWFLKLALFNSTVLGAYYLMLHLFGFESLAQDFAEMTGFLGVLLLVLANFTFFIYDFAIGKLYRVYQLLIYPRIVKSKH